MLARGQRSSDVETVAESQHESNNDLYVLRQLHQSDARGHGEEDKEKPDVPADGRHVDAQPRPLVSASPKEERRDSDDEHGEGREDGDNGDHALRQGGTYGCEKASHRPLTQPEAPS